MRPENQHAQVHVVDSPNAEQKRKVHTGIGMMKGDEIGLMAIEKWIQEQQAHSEKVASLWN